MRQYFELYIAFSRINFSSDRKICIDEFVKSVPTMAKWGIHVPEADAESEFKKIDENGGGSIMFDEFVNWAIEKKLDLDDDDDNDAFAELRAEQAAANF